GGAATPSAGKQWWRPARRAACERDDAESRLQGADTDQAWWPEPRAPPRESTTHLLAHHQREAPEHIRSDPEGKLEREADQEYRLQCDIPGDPAGMDETLEMLLCGESERWEKDEPPEADPQRAERAARGL